MSKNNVRGAGLTARSAESGDGTSPDPFVATDVILRDFPFFPLDIERLFNSRFHAIASDAEWRAGVTLWLKSYHQVPAGSLPNDDIELTRLAEFGKNLKNFLKVKRVALHGWIECADGRLYHRTVAEKVNEAWTRKQQQREGARKGNAKRWGARRQPEEMPDDSTTYGTPAPTGKDPVVPSSAVAQRSPTDRPVIAEQSPSDRQVITQPSPGDRRAIPQRSPTDRSPVASISIRDSIRDRRKEKDKTFCTEPSGDASVLPADIFLTLPLVGGAEHPITMPDLAFWHETYPAVDIEQGFRSMRAWLIANPARRKTPRGINRFVMAWLEREQNRGGSGPLKSPTTATERHERRRAQAIQWAREMMAEEGKDGGA